MRNLVTLLVVALTSATAASLPITSSPAYAALRQQTAGNILPLAPAACATLTGPGEIPAPGFVTCVDLATGTKPGNFCYGFPALDDLRLILVCPNRTEFDLGAASTDTAVVAT